MKRIGMNMNAKFLFCQNQLPDRLTVYITLQGIVYNNATLTGAE